MQITRILPRKEWEKISIIENSEPLILVEESKRFTTEAGQYLRKTIIDKLKEASENLPEGLVLKLIEGYRTLERTQKMWDMEFAKVRSQNPEWSDEQIEQHTRLFVVKPSPLANHHCGGAADVILLNRDETLVDMGSPYITDTDKKDDREKFPMLSELITEEQSKNREVLRTAMEQVGFVWYPGEWWHYCYGDRMWAVYSNKKECFYGSISELK